MKSCCLPVTYFSSVSFSSAFSLATDFPLLYPRIPASAPTRRIFRGHKLRIISKHLRTDSPNYSESLPRPTQIFRLQRCHPSEAPYPASESQGNRDDPARWPLSPSSNNPSPLAQQGLDPNECRSKAVICTRSIFDLRFSICFSRRDCHTYSN